MISQELINEIERLLKEDEPTGEALDSAVFLDGQLGIPLYDLDRGNLQWVKNVVEKLLALPDDKLEQIDALIQEHGEDL